MSAAKADYPSRPPKDRPKKPNKGHGAPSRTHGGGKRKTWVSDGSGSNGTVDLSPRQQASWFRSPYMQEQKRIRQGINS